MTNAVLTYLSRFKPIEATADQSLPALAILAVSLAMAVGLLLAIRRNA